MVQKCLVNIILKGTIFHAILTFQTVDFETFVETSYTCDFNFAVRDSQNLFVVSKVTV